MTKCRPRRTQRKARRSTTTTFGEYPVAPCRSGVAKDFAHLHRAEKEAKIGDPLAAVENDEVDIPQPVKGGKTKGKKSAFELLQELEAGNEVEEDALDGETMVSSLVYQRVHGISVDPITRIEQGQKEQQEGEEADIRRGR